MKNIKHIFFDLDNTLWDFDKNSREALLQLFNDSSLEEHLNTDFHYFIKVYEEINHHLWHKYHLNQTTKEELRYLRFHQTFQEFKYHNLDLAKEWADKYLIISPYKTHLIEGTLDVLNYLKPKYELHIITNGFKEVQYIKLHQSKLKDYFKEVIISEEHGYNKPDLKIFEIAQNLSNSNPNECVMIGDNFETDIKGALNANWDAVYLANEAPINFEHQKLTYINELKRLMHLL